MTKKKTLQKIPLMLIIKHDLYREALGFAICKEDPGFEIADQCGNSWQAIEIFAQSLAKIIIMDASMRPTGFAELTRELLSLDKTVKIIAMTNFFDSVRADRLVGQGAAMAISRDMPVSSIITVLRQIATAIGY